MTNITHVSWNVNGIRSVYRQGLLEMKSELKADVYCFQEVKARPEQVELEAQGYHVFWNPAEKAGYSGTLTLSKKAPIGVTHGLPGVDDREGRVQTIEFEKYYLVNVYTPNSKRDLSRLSYRKDVWDVMFLEHLKQLERRKPVAFCGDLNCAHAEIDLANPKANVKNAGFTAEERAGFDRYLKSGFYDSFRMFEPGPGHYTWWTWRNNARERNIGWRIDYFCVSEGLKSAVKKADILHQLRGSDHCPVRLILDSKKI